MSEESLFQKALSRAPEEHAALLELACAGRPELLAAVEAILAAHNMSADVLDRPPHDPARTEFSGPGLCHPGESVLRTTSREETSLAAAATAEYRPTSEAGTVIAGRYTLQEKTREFGMGEVWVAKQTEPAKRKMALKLNKSSSSTRRSTSPLKPPRGGGHSKITRRPRSRWRDSQ